MKPRVIIDIALLGYAQRWKAHARGVHRVTQHLVTGLVASGECELHFVATSSLAGAHDWLVEHGLSPSDRLSCRREQLWWSRRADKVENWIERTLPDRRLHMRGTRWLLQKLVRRADAHAGKITSRALRGAHIYHSPLFPIPAVVRRRRDLQKFLTIVDVIPLTNPSTVGGKGKPLLRKQLNSLTLESFAFCISETVKSELLSLTSLNPEHVFVSPLAASAEIFHPVTVRAEIEAALAAHGIPNEPYFLTLSSFDPRKNFEHVIHCFEQMVKNGSAGASNLVIVGSNPERNSHIDHVLRGLPEMRQKIIIPGFIPDQQLAAIYSGAIAFLFPSLSEGFGIPVLEAMRCGTPVISSNAPALPEVVGAAGILLEPRDVDAWCAAMFEISRDPELRAKLSARGLKRAREFTWDRFIAATLGGYRKSLETNNARPSAAAFSAKRSAFEL